jgi:adenine/guanine phosphoribosyltransferase-like PRPP-binding protein
MRVCALVSDLMDRSRISASIPDVVFVRDAAACAGAGVVIVDLARSGEAIGALRAALPHAAIVGFGPHVDEASAAAAEAAGANRVLPRSRFFHDPAAAIAGAGDA